LLSGAVLFTPVLTSFQEVLFSRTSEYLDNFLNSTLVGLGSTAVVLVIGVTWSGLDPYRRVDLQAPRDGPLALAVCRESLRTASRLQRGESVGFDLADHVFVWGETPLHRFDRMRWFLREGWGVRPQYGAGDAVIDGARAEVLLPIFEPRDLSVSLELTAPASAQLSAFVNGRPLGDGSLGPAARSVEFRIPASALFRGDNALTVAGPAGTRLHGLELKPAS